MSKTSKREFNNGLSVIDNKQLKISIACVEKAARKYLEIEDANLIVIALRLLSQRAGV